MTRRSSGPAAAPVEDRRAGFLRSLDTPAAVIDLAIVERNIARLQRACDRAGVRNRPHVKTHKSVHLARLQRAAGAVGITCQKLGEAEVMAEAGLDDILISYNVVGEPKRARLRALAARCTLTLSCDSGVAAEGYARALAGRDGPTVGVLVECDTGRRRSGVPDPHAAAALARLVAALPGLHFAGLLLYPPDGDLAASAAFVAAAKAACTAQGLPLQVISSGGTPNRGRIGRLGETEYRAGTAIYNDRQMVRAGAAQPGDCALEIAATVVSAPAPGRVLIDAGSKILSSDLGGFDDFGELPDHPQARLYRLAEEHGFVDVSACANPPRVGDVVRVRPNHACVVANLVDRVWCTRDGEPAGTLLVDARGRVS